MIRNTIQNAFRRFGFEIRRTPQELEDFDPLELPLVDVLGLIVGELVADEPDPFFVQIGANDGQTEDPLHQLVRRYGMRGLLVEPEPNAFERLVQNYARQPKLHFDNCLLGEMDGYASFYTVRKEEGRELPFWLYQSASLDRNVVSNALRVFRDFKGVTAIPEDHEQLIQELSVRSLTWRTLLKKHAISKIDLLVIDTMGFDFEILKLFPFGRMKPKIIHFEHSLLSPADQRACLKLLANEGYSLAKVAVDTIACLDTKTRHWLVSGW